MKIKVEMSPDWYQQLKQSLECLRKGRGWTIVMVLQLRPVNISVYVIAGTG